MSDDNVSSLAAARFHKNSDPAAHDPATALDAAREWLKELDHEPNHIIVMVGRDMPDGGSGTRYFQAGNYRHHAQMGLCHETMNMIRESADE